MGEPKNPEFDKLKESFINKTTFGPEVAEKLAAHLHNGSYKGFYIWCERVNYVPDGEREQEAYDKGHNLFYGIKESEEGPLKKEEPKRVQEPQKLERILEPNTNSLREVADEIIKTKKGSVYYHFHIGKNKMDIFYSSGGFIFKETEKDINSEHEATTYFLNNVLRKIGYFLPVKKEISREDIGKTSIDFKIIDSEKEEEVTHDFSISSDKGEQKNRGESLVEADFEGHEENLKWGNFNKFEARKGYLLYKAERIPPAKRMEEGDIFDFNSYRYFDNQEFAEANKELIALNKNPVEEDYRRYFLRMRDDTEENIDLELSLEADKHFDYPQQEEGNDFEIDVEEDNSSDDDLPF